MTTRTLRMGAAGCLAAAALALAPSPSQASVLLAGWNPGTTSSMSFPDAADAVYTALVSSASQTPVLLTANSDGRNVWGHANGSSTLDAGTAPYLSYTVQFQSGKTVELQKFFVGGYAQLDAQTTAILRSSQDGFTADLDTLSNSSSYTNNVADLSALSPVSGTIEFRIYFFNASAIYAANPQYANMFMVNSNSGRGGDPYDSLQGSSNIGLIGFETTAIPEPGTWTLLGLGVLALVALRQADQRKR